MSDRIINQMLGVFRFHHKDRGGVADGIIDLMMTADRSGPRRSGLQLRLQAGIHDKDENRGRESLLPRMLQIADLESASRSG